MKTFSSIYGLYFTCISDISSKIVLSSLNLFLVRADEWQMRMLSAKLDCTGQIFSGKLRVNDDITFKLQFYGFWRIGIKTIHQKYARKNLYNFWIEYSSSGWTKHSQAAQGFYKQVKRLCVQASFTANISKFL